MSWQLQEAKNKLSALIDEAVAGQEQIITRHGKPVVVVVPYDAWQDSKLHSQHSLFATIRQAAEFDGLPEVERNRDTGENRILPFFDEQRVAEDETPTYDVKRGGKPQ